MIAASVQSDVDGIPQGSHCVLAARRLCPTIRVLRESGSLYSYDAETLPGGRLHHYPTLEAIHDLRAESLKAGHLGWNVIALNIDVHTAFVAHTLDLHYGFIGRSLQHAVITASTRMIGVYRTTQRLTPEASSFLNGGGLTVDQDGAETGTVVHSSTLQGTTCELPTSFHSYRAT